MYCPYCGEEFPDPEVDDGIGKYECESCAAALWMDESGIFQVEGPQ